MTAEEPNALGVYAGLRGESDSDRAIRYAVSVVNRWIDNGGIYVPALDPETSSLDARFVPIFETRGHDPSQKPQFSGYDVTDMPPERWAAAWQGSERAAKIIRERAYVNMLFRRALPDGLGYFCALLVGDKVPPRVRKAVKPPQTHRDTLLCGLAKRVTKTFGFPLGANKATYVRGDVPTCGCTIAAAALYGHGIVVNSLRADVIARNKSLPTELLELNGALNQGHQEIVWALTGEARSLDEQRAKARQYFNLRA